METLQTFTVKLLKNLSKNQSKNLLKKFKRNGLTNKATNSKNLKKVLTRMRKVMMSLDTNFFAQSKTKKVTLPTSMKK